MSFRSRRTAILGFFIVLCAPTPTSESNAWQYGRPVQITDSAIRIMQVTSQWASDYDPATHSQGHVYFNDCVSLVNIGSSCPVPEPFYSVRFTGAGDVTPKIFRRECIA